MWQERNNLHYSMKCNKKLNRKIKFNVVIYITLLYNKIV